MKTVLHESFLSLLRLGIGESKDEIIPNEINWIELKTVAEAQGLSAVVLDGIELLQNMPGPPKEILLEWIGEVLQGEQSYKLHQDVAIELANLFHRNSIRTYVLKGRIVSECYPKPNHRVSSDMDCFLLPLQGDFNAWNLGNELIKSKSFDVYTDFYKNSTFKLPGLTVENHQYLTPFRGNERLASLEKTLQSLLRSDKGEDVIEGTWLYRPPVMVSALFLIEHAYSHFLHEGLTWRMVLDWMMFSKKHKEDVNWDDFDALVEEYGFRKFYDSYERLGRYLLGELVEEDLTKDDKKMLADVWAPLDLHETLHGVKGKLALAGNTWRARWKYSYFTDMNWMKALWIQTKGFLFNKNPSLK